MKDQLCTPFVIYEKVCTVDLLRVNLLRMVNHFIFEYLLKLFIIKYLRLISKYYNIEFNIEIKSKKLETFLQLFLINLLTIFVTELITLL